MKFLPESIPGSSEVFWNRFRILIQFLESMLIPLPGQSVIPRSILIPEPILSPEPIPIADPSPKSNPESAPESAQESAADSVPESTAESAPELIPNTESATRLGDQKIYNDGPWRAPMVRLEIDWPLQVANNKPQGKWLLYLDALPVLDMSGIMGDGRSTCDVLRKDEPDGAVVAGGDSVPLVNPLGLPSRTGPSAPPSPFTALRSANYTRAGRVRRDRAMVLRPQAGDGTVQMDCASQTAKCVRIVCKIHDLGPKSHALVTVTARLWNATLVSDYAQVDVVRIGSSARLVVEGIDELLDQAHHPASLTVRTEAFPEMGPPIVAMDVPWWIILIAAIAGLLVLIALTYLLYRCGFFRRKRHTGDDPTLSGNLERRRDPSGGGAAGGTYDELNDTNGSGGGTAERKPFLGRRS
uniref:Integrin alpha third immunoglobulin-like domain-containing protein n=1 Tax=Anopheles melas TaxID=34690 RepID=A0A182TWH1_9DIPT